jgi:hypothetical protein
VLPEVPLTRRAPLTRQAPLTREAPLTLQAPATLDDPVTSTGLVAPMTLEMPAAPKELTVLESPVTSKDPMTPLAPAARPRLVREAGSGRCGPTGQLAAPAGGTASPACPGSGGRSAAGAGTADRGSGPRSPGPRSPGQRSRGLDSPGRRAVLRSLAAARTQVHGSPARFHPAAGMSPAGACVGAPAAGAARNVAGHRRAAAATGRIRLLRVQARVQAQARARAQAEGNRGRARPLQPRRTRQSPRTRQPRRPSRPGHPVRGHGDHADAWARHTRRGRGRRRHLSPATSWTLGVQPVPQDYCPCSTSVGREKSPV